MNEYLPAILGFLGGGVVLAVVNAFFGRGKATVEVSGLKDDQTAEWRDSALALSTAAINANRQLMEVERKLHNCLQDMKDCDCK